MMRFIAIIILLANVVLFGGAGTEVVSAAQPTNLDDRTVTIDAHNRSLTDVVKELANSVGAGVICHDTDDIAVSLSLTETTFQRCADALADAFDVIITVNGKVLLVRPMAAALQQCQQQVKQGRLRLAWLLANCAAGRRKMYGSKQLQQRLQRKLVHILGECCTDRIQAGTMAPATAAGIARMQPLSANQRGMLVEYAVSGYLQKQRLQAALGVWNDFTRNYPSATAPAAQAELLQFLHHGDYRKAASFWRDTFSVDATLQVFDRWWRQGRRQTALHLVRMNIQYAKNAGMVAEARRLQEAVDERLQSRRVIQVTCAIDTEATSDPQCEAKVRARVQRVSGVFERAFNIAFKVKEIVTWEPPSVSDFSRQRSALKAALGAREPQLTIGFILEVFHRHPTKLQLPHKDMWVGYGCPHNGPYLLTRDFAFECNTRRRSSEWTFTADAVTQTLAHEMGHFFGALHVEDSGSIMQPVSNPQRRDLRFSKANRRVIMNQKWKDLQAGLGSLDAPELEALVGAYRDLSGACSSLNGAVGEQARVHIALGRLYRRRQQRQSARRHLEQVLAIGAPGELVVEAETLLVQR